MSLYDQLGFHFAIYQYLAYGRYLRDVDDIVFYLYEIHFVVSFFSEPSTAPLVGLIGEVFDEQWRV